MSETKTLKPPKRPSRVLISLGPFLRNILTSVAVTLLLGSCSQDEPIGMPSTAECTQPIVFNLPTDTVPTRAYVIDNESVKGGFGVFACTSEDTYAPEQFHANFMFNQKVFNQSGKWEYTPVKYWTTTSKRTSFLAYAPYLPTLSPILTYLESDESPNSHPSLRFNLPTDVSSQIDLSYASTLDVRGLGAPVINLDFEHALSRVAFTACSDLTDDQRVSGITIRVDKIIVESIGENPVYTSGTLALDTGEWSDLVQSNATFELTQEHFNFTTLPKDKSLITNADGYLMLIPQRTAYKNYPAPSNTSTKSFSSSTKSISKSTSNTTSNSTSFQNTTTNENLQRADQALTYDPSFSRAYTPPTPLDWKIKVESTIVHPDGSEYANPVYAVCSNVILTQGYGYEFALKVGVNSLYVEVKEKKWKQIDQNEWFTPSIKQERFDIRGFIPNMGRDDAVYTIRSLYDPKHDRELLKRQKTVTPGEFLLEEDDIDVYGMFYRNYMNLIIDNDHGQQWSLPIMFEYGFMQITIEIAATEPEEEKYYILPVGLGEQPATLIIYWGDGNYSREITNLTEENNYHIYAEAGQYPLQIISSQNIYSKPQITYIANGVHDQNRDELPDTAPYKFIPQNSPFHSMPSKIISLDTPMLHFEHVVHSTFCMCDHMKETDQNVYCYNFHVYDISYAYDGCVLLNKAPTIWTMSYFTRHLHTYRNCHPSNFSRIPASWL